MRLWTKPGQMEWACGPEHTSATGSGSTSSGGQRQRKHSNPSKIHRGQMTQGEPLSSWVWSNLSTSWSPSKAQIWIHLWGQKRGCFSKTQSVTSATRLSVTRSKQSHRWRWSRTTGCQYLPPAWQRAVGKMMLWWQSNRTSSVMAAGCLFELIRCVSAFCLHGDI